VVPIYLSIHLSISRPGHGPLILENVSQIDDLTQSPLYPQLPRSQTRPVDTLSRLSQIHLEHSLRGLNTTATDLDVEMPGPVPTKHTSRWQYPKLSM
jgi:hypothetical protein